MNYRDALAEPWLDLASRSTGADAEKLVWSTNQMHTELGCSGRGTAPRRLWRVFHALAENLMPY